MSTQPTKYIWLDCDPGHDDALAILLALHTPGLNLLGISTVHGNASQRNTHINAARLAEAFGAPPTLPIFAGASLPLIRSSRVDPEIHGADGLGGVEGLPPFSDPNVQRRIQQSAGVDAPSGAIQALAKAVRETWAGGKGEKVTIVATGSLTNIALFVSLHPALLEGVEQIVFMGGTIGVGNRGPLAEFNILVDAEAAQIVFDAPVPCVMVGLNVTHQTLLTPARHLTLLGHPPSPASSSAPLPAPTTPLRHMLHTLVSYFRDSYLHTFNFTHGPPLHDPLAVAAVARPGVLGGKRYRVDVERAGESTLGATVVDVWGYQGAREGEGREDWGRGGKNVWVAETVDAVAFFEMLFTAVDAAERVSPLCRAPRKTQGPARGLPMPSTGLMTVTGRYFRMDNIYQYRWQKRL